LESALKSKQKPFSEENLQIIELVKTYRVKRFFQNEERIRSVLGTSPLAFEHSFKKAVSNGDSDLKFSA
jgi:hypothetical protein